jgi:hypothetical protein
VTSHAHHAVVASSEPEFLLGVEAFVRCGVMYNENMIHLQKPANMQAMPQMRICALLGLLNKSQRMHGS